MDGVLRDLAKGHGCAADGAAAAANPMAQMMGAMLQAPVGAGGRMMAARGTPDMMMKDAFGRARPARGMAPRAMMPRPIVGGSTMAREFMQQQHNQRGWASEFMQNGPHAAMARGAPRSMSMAHMDRIYAQRAVAVGTGSMASAAPMMRNQHSMRMRGRGATAMGGPLMMHRAPMMMPHMMGRTLHQRPHMMGGSMLQHQQPRAQGPVIEQLPVKVAAAEQTNATAVPAEAKIEAAAPVVAGTGPSDTAQTAADVAAVLESQQDPKFQNSKLLGLMREVAKGEAHFGDNTVKAGPEPGAKAAPAISRAPQADADAAFAGGAGQVPMAALESAWKDAMDGKQVDFNKVWGQTLQEMQGQGAALGSAEAHGEVAGHMAGEMLYEFEGGNEYVDNDRPFELGMKLFREGRLKKAILAFEAEVQKNTDNTEGWRMLGQSHAEMDEDRKAIACLERAVDRDPYNLPALLALGVSYVNELDKPNALKNLKAWVQHNPAFAGLEVKVDPYSDGSLMDEVMQLMLQAEAHAPDPGVLEVLGVLYNVTQDYDSATSVFKRAVDARPDDYALWNKLGATMANGNHSEEAMPAGDRAYHRALELKPRYARGWLNLGIAHANVGTYAEAARCYLSALALNPNALHIWSYLRIAFTCCERFDLVSLTEKQDINAFRAEYDIPFLGDD